MSVCTCLFIEELDGESKVTDDTREVVAYEDVFALEVPVSDGRFLRHAVNDPLVVEVGQA